MVGNIVTYSVNVVEVEVVVISDITEEEVEFEVVCPSTSKDARLLLYGALSS